MESSSVQSVPPSANLSMGALFGVIAVAAHVVCAQAINAKQNEVCFFGGHSSLTKEVCANSEGNGKTEDLSRQDMR